LEIRLLIYQELLAPIDYPRLHIVNSDERLVSRRCVDNDPYHPSWYHKCCGRFLKRDATPNNYFYPVGERINPHPVRIQILRSCRRMYVQAHLNVKYDLTIDPGIRNQLMCFTLKMCSVSVNLERSLTFNALSCAASRKHSLS
jgi:hypothetical protein